MAARAGNYFLDLICGKTNDSLPLRRFVAGVWRSGNNESALAAAQNPMIMEIDDCA